MKFFNLNITKENLDWNVGFTKQGETNDNQAPYWIVAILSLTYIIGTFLLLIIIQYEKYGEDPKKRGLSNQVIIGFNRL